jgi:hypothetical protein
MRTDVTIAPRAVTSARRRSLPAETLAASISEMRGERRVPPGVGVVVVVVLVLVVPVVVVSVVSVVPVVPVVPVEVVSSPPPPLPLPVATAAVAPAPQTTSTAPAMRNLRPNECSACVGIAAPRLESM